MGNIIQGIDDVSRGAMEMHLVGGCAYSQDPELRPLVQPITNHILTSLDAGINLPDPRRTKRFSVIKVSQKTGDVLLEFWRDMPKELSLQNS